MYVHKLVHSGPGVQYREGLCMLKGQLGKCGFGEYALRVSVLGGVSGMSVNVPCSEGNLEQDGNQVTITNHQLCPRPQPGYAHALSGVQGSRLCACLSRAPFAIPLQTS